MDRYVQPFERGDRTQRDLLGGKGANLAEMTRLGLPVPPGFTVTTEACRAFLRDGREPDGMMDAVERHLTALEQRMGRRLGDPTDPLLVSVRSGARYSMPGMMETVLDIGLNDASVTGLADRTHDRRFALDSYRRLLQMFGTTVLGLPRAPFEAELERARHQAGTHSDSELDAVALSTVVGCFHDLIRTGSGAPFPQDPRLQLQLAIRAVFASWNTERAVAYRRQERIPDDLGTAVTVQAMVFGNRSGGSGSGVCFTRDPATGDPGAYGDYLPDAQGEDVVAGTRTPLPLARLHQVDPTAHNELLEVLATLERHFRDLCDVEFTIEQGRLWILQVRVGKRTAEAAFRMASDLVDEGLIDLDEALRRVTGDQLARLMFPSFDLGTAPRALTVGVNASPGAAVGRVALDSATAIGWAESGDAVVLVRTETTPDDLPGMIAALGVLTTRGGRTSHAAVVARGLGRTCVCGADEVAIDMAGRTVRVGPTEPIAEGELISLDGTTGAVYRGAVPVRDSTVTSHLEGRPAEDRLALAVDRLLAHADVRRRLGVRANADTAADAARARRFGAAGVGLCRTEHMFLGGRRQLIEDLVLADDEHDREAALHALLPLQRRDFTEILRAMDGLPVTVRLLDPPLHEFLPDLADLEVQVAVGQALGQVDHQARGRLDAVRRMHEQNPMLGLRGVRLGLVVPGLYAMQTRALAEATADLTAAGADPRPELMVPLVATSAELRLIRTALSAVLASVEESRSVRLSIPIGTMIEVPRAALTADDIATQADFFSVGTNDLTQTTWGLSRDDAEAAFLPAYLERGVVTASPFQTIDVPGVGHLVRTAVHRGRNARPGLLVGVCGEHGGDPRSIRFFEEAGLDYVSCSPYRVPVARLEAGRAAVLGE